MQAGAKGSGVAVGPDFPPLRVQLCGELVVEAGEERIEDRLRGRQGKLLFAFLVLSRSHWVARDAVLEAVWPDASRARAADLSTLLSRLRSALPPGAIAGRDQLRLELPPESWVDFEFAHEAAARAEAEMARGRWREAWGPAHAALSICDRELLPGMEADWVDARRRELADLRLDVLESVAQVGLRLGGSELAAAERAARRLIDLAPLRESGHVILMEVQDARGNRAEALGTFEQLRSRLRDELGASPGVVARALHDRLLGADAAPHSPSAEEAGSTLPLPPALEAPARASFVGRDRDLARLEILLGRARELRCQLALIAGEPGIGKTRLLAQLARRARDAGAVVLYGRADENGVIPYGPFVDAFRGASPGSGPDADRVLGLLTEHEHAGGSDEGSAIARLRFFDAVSDLLGQAAGDSPLLLALDDLHWAEGSTTLLLQHVIRDQRRRRMLVAIGYRDTEPARSDLAGAVADLGRELPVERIRLRPLAGADIAQIANEVGGGALPPEALKAIDAEAEGNPFFARELASHLAADGHAASRLPDSVSAVIERRLSRLAPATQEMLARASAFGREFDAELLEPLARGEADDVVAGLEEALGAGLIEEAPDRSDRFSFSHALVRSVLYEGLSPLRRLRLHERIADLLVERRHAGDVAATEPGSTAEIARHCLAALPRGDVERAVRFAEEAAREGISLLAYEEAIEHCRRGLAAADRHMADPGAHRLALLVQLCDAERLAGRMVEARATAGEAIEEARARGDSDALARAVLAHGGAGFESAFVDETMVALLEEALATVGPDDGMLRLRLLARLAKALHYAGEESDREKRSRLGAEALAMAGRLGEPRAELIALEGSHFALCQPGNLDQRLAAARRIIELAADLNDSEFGLLGRYFLIADLVEAGNIEAADQEIAEYGERAAAVDAALHRWYHARFLAMRALLAGRLEEAERRAQEAYALGSAVEPKTATMHFGTQLWILERERGALAALEEPVRGFVAEYPAVPAWRLGLAWVLLDQGRRDEASEAFSEFAGARFRNIPEDAIWTLTIALAAELAVQGLAGEEELEELVRLIEPYADRNAVSGEAIVSGGPLSLPLGMVELELGRREDAARHLEQAAAAARRMGAEPFLRRAEDALSRARA